VIGLMAIHAALPTAFGRSDPTPPGWTPLAQALKATVETGRPTVVIVTSRNDAASAQLRDGLAGILQTQAIGGQVQLAEMPSEAHAQRLRQMGVTSVPTVLVYTREGNGLRLAGYRVGMADPYQIIGWLGSVPLAPVPGAPAAADTGIVRTGGPSSQGEPSPQHEHRPSPQMPTQPRVEQPVRPPAPVYPQHTITAQMPPVVTSPPVTPTIVSPPASTFVVQPQPATLVMAPAPQPNIIFAGSAPNVPTISIAQPTAGSAPPAGGAPVNLISQPAPAPPAGSAPPAGAAPPSFAMAPTPGLAPQPGQAPQAGQGPISTALITMIAPSLFDQLLGAIGDRLRQRRLPRMEMGQAPVVNTIPGPIAAMAPPAGLAPTSLAAPAYAPMAPQVGYMPVGPPYPAYPPQGYAPPPQQPYYGPEYAPPPMPSAQGYGHPPTGHAPRKWGLFSR
jgi:hypothetical protein